jgi:hypothetical protein
MLYIYMLGYDVDFGHMEAVSLISAPKYPEKQVSIIFAYQCEPMSFGSNGISSSYKSG